MLNLTLRATRSFLERLTCKPLAQISLVVQGLVVGVDFGEARVGSAVMSLTVMIELGYWRGLRFLMMVTGGCYCISPLLQALYLAAMSILRR